jgi:hypothetical protein
MEAVSCFREELAMLQSLAPSVGMARHVLRNLQNLISATKDVIQKLPPASDVTSIYPYPRAMELPAPAAPNTVFNAEEQGMIDSLLADASFLNLVLPSSGDDGAWTGESFDQQWMQMTGG